MVDNKVISVQHIPGDDNHSDIHTKPLSGWRLHYHTVGILGEIK